MLWGIESELWCLLWWSLWSEFKFLRIDHNDVFVGMQRWWHMTCVVILTFNGFDWFCIEQINVILSLRFSRTYFCEVFLNFALFEEFSMLQLKILKLFCHFAQLKSEVLVDSHDLLWWQFFLWSNLANYGLFSEWLIRYHFT